MLTLAFKQKNHKLDIVRNIKLTLVVLCFTTTLCSQVNHSEVAFLKGRVVSEKNKPLSFAHVINESQKYATVTDTTGHFRIPALQGDSIKVSSVGYFTKTIRIKTINIDTLQIVLKRRAYNLAVVNINEIRWQVFKSEFMEKEIEESKAKKQAMQWIKRSIQSDEIRMIYQNATRKDWLYLNKYKR